MSRLPTIKLRRRDERGQAETLIVNVTDYQRRMMDLIRAGWKSVGERHGDATDAEVDFLARQDEKEMARERNPNHHAYGDAARTYEARQGRPDIRTEPNPNLDGEIIPVEAPPVKRGPGRPRKNPA